MLVSLCKEGKLDEYEQELDKNTFPKPTTTPPHV